MLKFTINIEGLDEMKKQLGGMGEILDDLTPELTEAGDWWVDFSSVDVFETEGQAIDESWEDLTPSYAKWKGENYPGRGILERTSTLRYGFKAIPSSKALILMNDTPWGVHLEFGTDKMPARVFMKLDEERLEAIRDIIVEGINDRIKSL